MKKLLFFLSIYCFSVLFNNLIFAQYSNFTLTGPWFLDTIPAQIYNAKNNKYLTFDGGGHIIDGTMFCYGYGGYYSVTPSGAVNATFICGVSLYPFSAQLISQDYATVGSGWALSRIMNPGALMDSLVGTLYTANCGQKDVTFRMSSYGEIVYASGLAYPLFGYYGKIYADSGHFAGHIKTGETNSWAEFTILGAYIQDSLIGNIQFNLNCDTCGANSVRLKRFGTISSVKTDVASTNNVIVYPNPAVDFITVKFNNADNKYRRLTIYNLFGEVVHTEIIKQNINKINISELNNGIYMLEINSDKGSVKQKILIQK